MRISLFALSSVPSVSLLWAPFVSALVSRHEALARLGWTALVAAQTLSMTSSLPTCAPDIARKGTIRILVHGGDNMLGRAVQLSLPVQSPGEEDITDSCPASHYLDMCLNHPSWSDHSKKNPNLKEIRKLNLDGGKYLWGDSLALQRALKSDIRILNLETSVTRTIDNKDVPYWKGIRYHLHSDNALSLLEGFRAADPSSPVIVSLANNHIMDYGKIAFHEETLPLFDSMARVVSTVGCGRTIQDAQAPMQLILPNTRHVQAFAASTGCSGTPGSWHATESSPGLWGLPALFDQSSVQEALKQIGPVLQRVEKLPGTIRIFSIHWGPNWALKGETKASIRARQELAHALVDRYQVDLVYGHSSHHMRGIELYHNKLILYGAGDIINDYEGFENTGEEKYNRIGGLFVVDMHPDGNLEQLRIVPMIMNRLHLQRYTKDSMLWRPQLNRLEAGQSKSKELAEFVNQLSEMDAGLGTALLMEHADLDPDIPGGPVLMSKVLPCLRPLRRDYLPAFFTECLHHVRVL